MKSKTRSIAQGGMIAALYLLLTYAQNFLWPGSTSMAIQFRLSEALCVLAFFTPAAIPGLTLGCFLYNISWAQALPLDWLVGSLATLGAALCMWNMRRLPSVLGLLMPALWNAVLVGWELTKFLAPAPFNWGVFGMNALYVAIGEATVLLVLGWVLYAVIRKKGLAEKFAL